MNNITLSKIINIRVLPFIKTKWKKAKFEKEALMWYVRKTIEEALTNEEILKNILAAYEKENCNI